MATLTLAMGLYQVDYGWSGTWESIAGNTIVFSGNRLDLTIPIPVGDAQLGTHLGTGTPGTSACPAGKHGNNVQYIDPVTMKFWYYNEQAINDTNLLTTECTFRLHFAETGSVVTTPRFFAYDNSNFGNYVTDMKIWAFERGVGAQAWTPINDGASGLGGDYSGDRLDLEERPTPANDHYWYIAVSASPEKVGEFDGMAFGAALIYS